MDIVYRTTYEGESYPPDGEPGPTTTNPRKLAEETLRPGQRMIATGPDGQIKVFKYLESESYCVKNQNWKEAFGIDI
jgi:hypothetical protein